eukprot:939223-Prymnesium_polylepis.1
MASGVGDGGSGISRTPASNHECTGGGSFTYEDCTGSVRGVAAGGVSNRTSASSHEVSGVVSLTPLSYQDCTDLVGGVQPGGGVQISRDGLFGLGLLTPPSMGHSSLFDSAVSTELDVDKLKAGAHSVLSGVGSSERPLEKADALERARFALSRARTAPPLRAS